jgi:hypothetical protein
MKIAIQALVTTAVVFGFLTAGADARADSKQECAAAYVKTQSLRDNGQLRDARKQAITCSASTCSAYVIKDCTRWLAEIDASLPTVVFTASNAAGAETLAVRVTVDGQPVIEQLDGKAVTLDPGERLVRFEMIGAEAVEQKVIIQQGEKNRKLTVSFPKTAPSLPLVLPPTAPPPRALAASKPVDVPRPVDTPKPVSRSGGVPLWAWISGGAGVVALGVGAGFGVSALEAQSELNTKCGGDATHCPDSIKAETGPLADRRNLGRNVFIGLEAAAAVGIGLAVIGIARAPSRASSPRKSVIWAPFASPFGGGVEMQGQF